MARRTAAVSVKRPKNTYSILLVTIVVLMVFIVMSVNKNNLAKKMADYNEKEAYLLERIAEQEERAKEIEEYATYKQTKQYIEDMAKQKLGLVYKDEIIFEAEN